MIRHTSPRIVYTIAINVSVSGHMARTRLSPFWSDLFSRWGIDRTFAALRKSIPCFSILINRLFSSHSKEMKSFITISMRCLQLMSVHRHSCTEYVYTLVYSSVYTPMSMPPVNSGYCLSLHFVLPLLCAYMKDWPRTGNPCAFPILSSMRYATACTSPM